MNAQVALAVYCPVCCAPPGRGCATTGVGPRQGRPPHVARYREAGIQAAPVPPRRAIHAVSLARQIAIAGLPEPVAEYRFAPPRRWRMDLAWPDRRLFAEREGGVWTGGRHTRPSGFLRDLEKYNAAALLGWRLLRFTPAMERSGEALELVRRALQQEDR